MKTRLAFGSLLIVSLVFGGCASGAPSGASGGARCLGRPDTSGTQPMIYLLCIQSG